VDPLRGSKLYNEGSFRNPKAVWAWRKRARKLAM